MPIGRLADGETGMHCLKADGIWSLVGAKDCKQWVWLAIVRRTGVVVGSHVGSRDREGALGLWLSRVPRLLGKSIVFADDYPSYGKVFAKGQLQ